MAASQRVNWSAIAVDSIKLGAEIASGFFCLLSILAYLNQWSDDEELCKQKHTTKAGPAKGKEHNSQVAANQGDA